MIFNLVLFMSLLLSSAIILHAFKSSDTDNKVLQHKKLLIYSFLVSIVLMLDLLLYDQFDELDSSLLSFLFYKNTNEIRLIHIIGLLNLVSSLYLGFKTLIQSSIRKLNKEKKRPASEIKNKVDLQHTKPLFCAVFILVASACPSIVYIINNGILSYVLMCFVYIGAIIMHMTFTA